MRNVAAPILPKPMRALVAMYFVASLAHFGHNAEYIALYPGMPGWLTRETVYLAWLGVTSLGAAAWLLRRWRLHSAAIAALGIYGAFGLDGLAHYTLALCSEHTIVANVTIWAEATIGLLLLVVSSLALGRRLGTRGVA